MEITFAQRIFLLFMFSLLASAVIYFTVYGLKRYGRIRFKRKLTLYADTDQPVTLIVHQGFVYEIGKDDPIMELEYDQAILSKKKLTDWLEAVLWYDYLDNKE